MEIDLKKYSFGPIFLYKFPNGKKFCYKESKKEIKFFQSFCQEANIQEKFLSIHHPGIDYVLIPILIDEEFNLIKYEHCVYGSFFNMAPTTKGVDESKIMDNLRLLYQIYQSIQFLHLHGIIHGDIKLENCLISNNRNALLCDFDKSVMECDAPNRRLLGTLGCVPNIRAGEWTRDADWWSFGMLALNLYLGLWMFDYKDRGVNGKIDAAMSTDKLEKYFKKNSLLESVYKMIKRLVQTGDDTVDFVETLPSVLFRHVGQQISPAVRDTLLEPESVELYNVIAHKFLEWYEFKL